MSYFEYKLNGDFDLEQTLDSGQCFRYFDRDGGFIVVSGRRAAHFVQEGDCLKCSSSKDEFNSYWLDYFDLSRDYAAIKKQFSFDEVMKKSMEFAYGVRVMRQDFFENLITFIISQQNNIPRIKKIVNSLCENFGEKIDVMGDVMYSFPTVEVLANLDSDKLSVINAGYRAAYIIDGAKKVLSGEITEENIRNLDYENAKAQLKKINGVGDKVANCVLLFGAGHIQAFPIDVWIKRGIDEMYNGVLDTEIFSPYGGIAQQYLFYYMRKGR